MKHITFFILILLIANPAISASSCPETGAAQTALSERNSMISGVFESVPNPEDDRELIAGCIESINAIGNSFSLGVSFPSLDNLIGKMCEMVNSYIQSKISEAMNKVKVPSSFGSGKLYQVDVSPDEISVELGKNIL